MIVSENGTAQGLRLVARREARMVPKVLNIAVELERAKAITSAENAAEVHFESFAKTKSAC